jgi:hypothetical protein
MREAGGELAGAALARLHMHALDPEAVEAGDVDQRCLPGVAERSALAGVRGGRPPVVAQAALSNVLPTSASNDALAGQRTSDPRPCTSPKKSPENRRKALRPCVARRSAFDLRCDTDAQSGRKPSNRARPRGFEPLTFGAVERRSGSATSNCCSRSLSSRGWARHETTTLNCAHTATRGRETPKAGPRRHAGSQPLEGGKRCKREQDAHLVNETAPTPILLRVTCSSQPCAVPRSGLTVVSVVAVARNPCGGSHLR